MERKAKKSKPKKKNKMAIIRKKDIPKMNKEELGERLKELKLELLRQQIQKGGKTGNLKIREIKKTIARILTQFNKNKKIKQTK